MEQKKQYSRALLPFYVLVIYVVVQFFWWSYLMVNQNNIIYGQQITMASADPARQAILHAELQRKWFMIAGEGSVFLVLMLIGILQVRKAFKKESELLARQKTFLHSVTHEFKSPIASLRLQIETLLKRSLSGELQQQALSNALEDTERLDRLSEKVLMAARIDNGELPIYPEKIDLSQKLSDTITQISRAYSSRKIEQSIAPNIIIEADAWAITSVITNLLENALQYSQDTPVSITLMQRDGNAFLTFTDTGVGIPQEERKNIFQKFYRLNTSSKGTGLGLYLVDYFVKKHKGTIIVKENSPKGSIFEVALPLKKYDK